MEWAVPLKCGTAHCGRNFFMQSHRKSSSSLSRREALSAYTYIGPWIVGFILITLGPMVASLYFSFTDYNIVSPATWVGLGNYRHLFSDPLFWKSLGVTLKFGALSLPLQIIFGFTLAILLNQNIPGVNIFRTIFYIPATISGVAIALVWGLILNPERGLLNPVLSLFGINGPAWLQNPDTALYGLVIISLWGVGGGVIIYLAGLQGVPTELYEAAKVDGANIWQQFMNVTLPMVTPVLFYNLVLGLINTFQYFTEVFILTRGGPARATLVYNLYLYQNAFSYNHMGYASALAWVLFVITLVLTVLVFRSSATWVYYEGQLKGR
jgi:multiple sugar transport system permease protein